MQETRELRALAIAATTNLQRGAHGWHVPSQSGTGTYLVDPEMGSCTCPDHEVNAATCKHLLAVRLTIKREPGENGSYKITKVAQVTYTQEWSAYNAAACGGEGPLLGTPRRSVQHPPAARTGQEGPSCSAPVGPNLRQRLKGLQPPLVPPVHVRP